MVSELTFWTVIGGISTSILILATAVYVNRRKMNTIIQRLFGTKLDASDEGILIDLQHEVQDVKQQMTSDHSEVMNEIQDLKTDD